MQCSHAHTMFAFLLPECLKQKTQQKQVSERSSVHVGYDYEQCYAEVMIMNNVNLWIAEAIVAKQRQEHWGLKTITIIMMKDGQVQGHIACTRCGELAWASVLVKANSQSLFKSPRGDSVQPSKKRKHLSQMKCRGLGLIPVDLTSCVQVHKYYGYTWYQVHKSYWNIFDVLYQKRARTCKYGLAGKKKIVNYSIDVLSHFCIKSTRNTNADSWCSLTGLVWGE